MTDYKLYETLENKLRELLRLNVYGQVPPESKPPYIILNCLPLIPEPLTGEKATANITIKILSRYLGGREIQDLHRIIINKCEGLVLTLENNVMALLRFEESQLNFEKDGVTRLAEMKFTALLQLR